MSVRTYMPFAVVAGALGLLVVAMGDLENRSDLFHQTTGGIDENISIAQAYGIDQSGFLIALFSMTAAVCISSIVVGTLAERRNRNVKPAGT